MTAEVQQFVDIPSPSWSPFALILGRKNASLLKRRQVCSRGGALQLDCLPFLKTMHFTDRDWCLRRPMSLPRLCLRLSRSVLRLFGRHYEVLFCEIVAVSRSPVCGAGYVRTGVSGS